MNIIGLGGKKKSGKGEVAKTLTQAFGYEEYAFAEPVKNLLLSVYKDQGLVWEHLYNAAEKDEPFEFDCIRTGILEMDRIMGWAETYAIITPEMDSKALEIGWMRLCRTPRELMQFVGTDICRKCIADDFWVQVAKKQVGDKTGIVFSDIRFDNELAYVKSLGGFTLLIHRPGSDDIDTHDSEQLPQEGFDRVVLNDSTLEHLRHTVLQLCAKRQL